MTMKTQSYLGKYREIILAVAFFLIFDMAVLVLNFYISFQLSDSAINLNLSGRQRMLSQRMTKSLMIKQIDTENAVTNPKNDEELAKTVELFDTTLNGFENGGMVMGTDSKKVLLKALHAPKYTDILHQAEQLWQPYKVLLSPVLRGTSDPNEIKAVVDYARQHNVELLTLMNKLTTELEKDASQRADFLRYVQTAGMLLATLNFLFILFKFIRRLRENDRLVEAAQQETAEILGTVKEGLFLLDADYRIGSQFSASLSTILGTTVTAGMDFREELRKRLSSDRFEAASDYIGLLLAGRVNEALVEDLNPLIAIPLQFASVGGQSRTRYLTFEFNRVVVDGVISHLLVSVFDVTEQQALEIALAEAKKQAKTEVEVMLEILRVNPALLAEFLTATERVLQAINNELKVKHSGRDPKKLIQLVFRHIHTIKGEAAALGLDLFESLAHEFEQTLAALRDKTHIDDDDLLALPGPLDEFFQKVAAIQELNKKLENYSLGKAQPSLPMQAPPLDSFVSNLNELAQRIARDHEKSVNLTAELERLETLPAKVQKEVKDITLQLLRNAVAHGVEPVHVRKQRNKAPVGSIYVGLGKEGENYELVVRDDGHGLVADDIRQALIDKGLYTEAQLQELDPKQIIMKIFEPGFSTTVEADRDSGQGVGMDIVKQKIGALGARLGIASQKNLYTMFSIRFQA
jgi:two-component system chemotaxis sensor kinase CheA